MNRKCVACDKFKKPDRFAKTKAGVYHPRMYYTCVECVGKTEQLTDPEDRLVSRIHEASLGVVAGVNNLSVDMLNPESMIAGTGNEHRLSHLGLSCKSVHGETHARWLNSVSFTKFWEEVPDVVRRHQHDLMTCKEFHTESHPEWVKTRQWNYQGTILFLDEQKRVEDAKQRKVLHWVLGVVALIGIVAWIEDCGSSSGGY